MADASTTARWAARQSVIDNALGDVDIDGLAASLVNAVEAEEAITLRIGQLFVDSDEMAAQNLRDRLYSLQTVREVAERLLDEARNVQENRP